MCHEKRIVGPGVTGATLYGITHRFQGSDKPAGIIDLATFAHANNPFKINKL